MEQRRCFHPSDIAEQLRSSLRELLGEDGTSVLEYHLKRNLEGDIYQIFFKEPSKFYLALSAFIGAGGAAALLRVLAHHLIEKGLLRGITPDEFLTLFKDESEEAVIRLQALFLRGLKPLK